MTSIVGIDVSSRQLDFALLRDDLPPWLWSAKLGKTSDPLIERVRCVRSALREEAFVVDWWVVEDAYGPSGRARKALDYIVGAIISNVPAEAQVATVRATDWRRALGAKNTKLAGHYVVFDWIANNHVGLFREDISEHAADALGVALGWRAILAAQQGETAVAATSDSGKIRGVKKSPSVALTTSGLATPIEARHA